MLRTYTFDGYNEWWSTLHMCDICCDEIAVGSRCLRCDACDYDICPNCTAASDVALDLDKSFSCFLSAASDGHARAQYILGHCYEDGMGAPVDLAAAAMWYQRAAAQGIAAAGAAFVALDLSDCEIVVDRHDILHSTLESFSRVPDARLSSSEVVVEFRGEEGVDGGGLFNEWMSLLTKQLFCPPLFLPVTEKGCLMHCLRLNPMPEQFFPSPADCHQRLRLVGILLGLSVSRRVPLGVDLTPAFCKLLLRHEANFEDLRAELPDEYEWMNDIKTAMQQASCAAQDPSHAADAKLRVNDEEHRRLFNTPSRRLQVWECINRLKEARPDAYGDMLGLFEERCLRHSGRPDDDEVLSFVPLEPSSQSGDAFVSGRNFEEYVASAVKKQLSTNLQEAMAHIYPPFEAAARYTSTDDDSDDDGDEDVLPAEELRCRLGDVSIADLQAQFSGLFLFFLFLRTRAVVSALAAQATTS